VIYAPKTFILKFCIGLITGLVAHKLGKISTSNDNGHVFRFTLLAATIGMLFNVIFDPLFGYFYKLAIIGEPAAKVALVWNITATSINAVLSIVVSVIIYMALRPVLRKSGLLPTIGKKDMK
jgi:thiamine transporter ThiT